ncbi:unnamed protein product [Durusdinium trenchii]|uniref:Uncharacterized protein n=1 Tax=Durusdinium trenchii TaxID=1381693 RepID=A0ABP0RDL4_9DINO
MAADAWGFQKIIQATAQSMAETMSRLERKKETLNKGLFHNNLFSSSLTCWMYSSFLKIFRLELLGDFELAELEGLDEQVKGKFKHGVFEGETGNFNHEKFHTWLCMEFMAMSIVFTVAMNVYIGLLSELYDKAVERKNGLYNHWLASTAYRFLCRSVCLCRFGRCVPEDKGPGQHQSGLMWFAYEEDHLLDVAT